MALTNKRLRCGFWTCWWKGMIADLCTGEILWDKVELLILERAVSPTITLTCSYVDLAPYKE